MDLGVELQYCSCKKKYLAKKKYIISALWKSCLERPARSCDYHPAVGLFYSMANADVILSCRKWCVNKNNTAFVRVCVPSSMFISHTLTHSVPCTIKPVGCDLRGDVPWSWADLWQGDMLFAQTHTHRFTCTSTYSSSTYSFWDLCGENIQF